MEKLFKTVYFRFHLLDPKNNSTEIIVIARRLREVIAGHLLRILIKLALKMLLRLRHQ